MRSSVSSAPLLLSTDSVIDSIIGSTCSSSTARPRRTSCITVLTSACAWLLMRLARPSSSANDSVMIGAGLLVTASIICCCKLALTSSTLRAWLTSSPFSVSI
ncbi:hypothetical protein D3C72_1981880 [compost metagenome]